MSKEIKCRKFKSADGKEFEVSFCRLNKGKQGPTLTLIAGQHGMEHIGPVVLKQFINQIEDKDFRGTINICPCANPLALELDYEFYPEKEDISKIDNYFYSRFRHDYCVFGMGRRAGYNWHNMNRLWNKSKIYGVAGEVTSWLWNETVAQADLTIDFHCFQDDKPSIFNCSKKTKTIATYFGIKTILPTTPKGDFAKGALSFQASNRKGKYAFTVEFSRQHGYKNEYAIGNNGILNVMKGIGMMDGEIVHGYPIYEIKKHHAFESDAIGHIHYKFNQYDPVKKGDLLFEISSLENFEILDHGYSPVDGIFGRRTFRPISQKNEAVASVIEVDILAEAGKPLEKTII